MLSGTLTESVPCGYADGRVQIRDTERAAGSSVKFGRHYIHDVRNAGADAAISVHAYSPPLSSMTYYDVAGGRSRRGEDGAHRRPGAVRRRCGSAS